MRNAIDYNVQITLGAATEAIAWRCAVVVWLCKLSRQLSSEAEDKPNEHSILLAQSSSMFATIGRY